MTHKKLIIVIDDDIGIREALSEMLTDEGHELVCCGNGREGLAILRARVDEVCIVLLDLMMPIMSGWEFRREQLADPAIAHVPVVVISASPERAEELRAPVLQKPLGINAVMEHVVAGCA